MTAVKLKHRLILASASPRRRELLTEAGYEFEVVPSRIPEPVLPETHGVSAAVWAEALAYFKARSVAERHSDAVILGADTVVSYDNRIIGKAADENEARQVLTEMFGGCNDVITGVALLGPDLKTRIITHVCTTLPMHPMNPADVEAYIQSGAWRDKAGAYAIQEGGDRFVEKIEGSHSNIVGLPMEKVQELLGYFNA